MSNGLFFFERCSLITAKLCSFFSYCPMFNYPTDAVRTINELERDADTKFYEEGVRSENLYI